MFNVAKMPVNVNKVHQSVYRSDGILTLVKIWLDEGVPSGTISRLIESIEDQDALKEGCD